MQIKSIYIKGMKQQDREVNMELSGLNVSVIYGENGCGKTTLLRLISAVLEQQDSVLLNEKVEEVTIVYINDNGEEETVVVSRREVDVPVKVKREDGSIEEELFTTLEYDWSELRRSELSEMTSILFGVNRGIASSVNISADYCKRSISWCLSAQS